MVENTAVGTFNGGTIRKILTHGKPNVRFAHYAVVGRIETDPSLAGNIRLGPRGGGAFATHAVLIRADVSADVARRHVDKPQHEQQDMSEVLAYAGFQLPDFIRCTFNGGYSLLILEITVDIAGEIDGGFKRTLFRFLLFADHFL